MRTKLIALVPSLAVLAFAASAQAGVNKGFYYNGDQNQLVAAATKALADDPTGLKPMDPVKCAKDGSCGSLQNYADAFKAYDGVTLTVAQVPGFIASLKLDCNVSDDYFMARVVMRGKGPGIVELDKMHRRIGKDECALVDPNTGRVVIALHCANPVGKLYAPPPCAEVAVHANRKDYVGNRLRVHYAGSYQSDCPAEQLPWQKTRQPLPPDCNDGCYSEHAATRSDNRNDFSVTMTQEGVYRFFVPRECMEDTKICEVWFCMDNDEHSTEELLIPPNSYDRRTNTATVHEDSWVIEH